MKSRVPVIVAVVVAVIAVFAIHTYVRNIKAQYEQREKGEPVVSASVDIPVGTELEPHMLTPKEVPARFIPPQAVKGSKEVKLILGQKTSVPIKAGQILLWSDLLSEKRGGFESVVPPGERAFTVSMASGIRGELIQPSDHIDVLATFALPEAKNVEKTPPASSWRDRSDMVNIVLLQNVTVLAVGGTYLAGSMDAGAGKEFTLAVTLPESQLLMFAAQHGELAAVLRKQNDIETVPREKLPRVTFQELENLIGDLDAQRKHRIVEVIKGAEREEVRIEDSPGQ